MKKLFFFLLLASFLMGMSGCVKKGCTDYDACNYDSDADKDDGTCNYGCNGGGGGGGGGGSTGNITFWNDQSWIGQITVYLGSSSGTISSNTEPSSCNTSGCANFSGAAGSYSYTASATTGETWSGTASVSSGGCMLVYLYD